jgi:uncharacterized protein
MLTVSELNIYPVKSLRGTSLTSAKVTDRGFQHDRRWMLVDGNGTFMTQRDFPQMAFINVELENNGLRVFHRKKNLDKHLIPFNISKSKVVNVPIWDDTCSAIMVGKDSDKWFSEALGVECSLVFQPDETHRPVDDKYSKNKNEFVSFADGYPFLIIGQSSLDDLNSKLEQPLPMNRFRPNIVFTGGKPFLEDELKEFKINDITFYGVKQCARCAITTTNQETAERLHEPLKTLATYRKFENKIMFGMNLLNKEEGVIKVGDKIEIL